MLLDLVVAAGEVLSIFGMLYGAYLALMETEPFLSLFGKKPARPLPPVVGKPVASRGPRGPVTVLTR